LFAEVVDSVVRQSENMISVSTAKHVTRHSR